MAYVVHNAVFFLIFKQKELDEYLNATNPDLNFWLVMQPE